MRITPLILAWIPLSASFLPAQDDAKQGLSATLERAARQATQRQQFEFRYQFPVGETLRWNVEHISTNKTSMEEVTEVMSSRTESTTAWKVLSLDSHGNATLEQTIESANWWQKTGDKNPISFNSADRQPPPQEFASMAQTVGRPLMTMCVDPLGTTISSSAEDNQYKFGTGSPWIPFPQHPIAVGDLWYEPSEVTAFNEDKSIRRVKLRIRYELADVRDQKATINFSTEILTPVDDPHVQSQLLQRITRGVLTFDLARGRMVGKRVNWNEKVQGFHGPNSLLHYLGQYTVLILEPTGQALSENPSVSTAKPLKLRTRYDAPVFRR
jgi:hypothetical protein